MQSILSKKIVAAAVAVAALGGAAGAYAATQGSTSSTTNPATERQAYLNDLAGRLGVSADTLTTDMKAAADDQVDAAVTAGTLTATQGAALKQRIANGDGLPLLGGLARHQAAGLPMMGHGIVGAGLDAAAQYLAISTATLRSDLASGQTLAQIAAATTGKSADGLKAALLAAAKTRLDQAVTNGTITSTQEQTILNALTSRVDTLMQQTFTGTGMRGRGLGRHGVMRHRAAFGIS